MISRAGTAYENFMDELDSEQEVSVHVEAHAAAFVK